MSTLSFKIIWSLSFSVTDTDVEPFRSIKGLKGTDLLLLLLFNIRRMIRLLIELMNLGS